MGHHIKDGKFVSDKYRVIRLSDGSDGSVDKLVLSFHDPVGRRALTLYAECTDDEELSEDIFKRLELFLRLGKTP